MVIKSNTITLQEAADEVSTDNLSRSKCNHLDKWAINRYSVVGNTQVLGKYMGVM